ncbi:MAG: hypothetical protein ACTSRZ_01025 [Promethearchaeota archaeon]
MQGDITERNRIVKKFVRETLGCNCSDDVFRIIEIELPRLEKSSSKRQMEENIFQPSENHLKIKGKINIGNRLLIYLVYMEENLIEKLNENENYWKSLIQELTSDFEKLIISGKKERDARNFNRLRLVLVNINIDEKFMEILSKIQKKLKEIFELIKNKHVLNEKIHLHIINDSREIEEIVKFL